MLYPIIRLVEMVTISALITQTPRDNAWMIELHRYIMLIALHHRSSKLSLYHQRIIIISEAMAFLISLSNDIKAILITKVIPARIIGIVARSDGIDVQTLHDFNVLNHAIERHNIASIGVNFMAVGTLYEDRHTINKHLRAFDFNLSKAHLLCDNLFYLAFLVFHRSHKSI